VRSPAACTEYEGDPDATARTFRNGYAFPGDRGYLDEAGVLHVIGRADVINVGGDKVDPLEVEAVIRDALPVADVVVLEGRRAGLPALRVIAEADPAQVTGAMIMALCRERLSPHKVPARVEVRERLPRDENGKVVRALLDA
jgi:acyl-coenzyme A synthetase/AMP-(fatty) acid ligase